MDINANEQININMAVQNTTNYESIISYYLSAIIYQTDTILMFTKQLNTFYSFIFYILHL